MIEKIKSTIIEIISRHPGIDGTSLVLFLTEKIKAEDVIGNTSNVNEIVEELISEGSLVAVDYILPTQLYRNNSYTKSSRLYPKGTKIVIWDNFNLN
jgi:hypothetical protein